jgi:inorganic pyrophosphatase
MSNLLTLPCYGENGELNVVVEAPRASIKLKYDPGLEAFTVSRALPIGVTYPFDWGFIPQTVGADGDPIDALAIHDAATYPGVVLPCRPLGVVEVEQDGESGRGERNDRIIAMPTWHDRMGEFERATDLPARLRQEIEQFFLEATFFTAKNAKVLRWRGAKRAASLISTATRKFSISPRKE